ncbi:MAG: hypothetical protein ACI4UE_05290 [Candidatus Scatovivens sp.]
MAQKLTKMIIMMILLSVFLTAIGSNSFAKMTKVETGFTTAEGKISPNNTSNIYVKTNDVVNIAIGVMQLVGVGIAVIMLIVLAIKYMSAAPGDRAEIKKHAVVYVVGAVVLFGAAGILEIIKNFALSLA